MAWKAIKTTEEIQRLVASVFAADYERRTVKRDSFDEWMGWQQVRDVKRWASAESVSKSKQSPGRLVTVHGICEQTSIVFVYGPLGNLLGSFSEHHGEDRGPNRRKRVERLLGPRGAKLL